jgi:undecaprenyl-phosphate galactose phosphotransferase/putative colanic acid biosynthesis UDP-glucose lipid carrier transferase
VGPILAACDAFLVTAASLIGGVGYHLVTLDGFGDVNVFFGVGLAASIAYAFAAWHLQIYNIPALLRPRWDYGRILMVWAIVILMLASLLFFFKVGSQISRGYVSCFVALSMISLIAWRGVVKPMLRTAFANGAIEGRRVVLMGTRSELAALNSARLIFDFGLREIDRVTLPDHNPANPSVSQAEIAAIEAALERTRRSKAEEIVLVMPWMRSSYFNLLSECLRTSPLPARLLPDHFIRSTWTRGAGGSLQPLIIDIQRAPLSKMEQSLKRAFDVVVTCAIVFLIAPVLAALCVFIKLDSRGPVIFRQHRKGFNGKEFVIYKFRTMTVMENGRIIAQARKGDARVTRVGRVLRRSSFDELPQLLNVLKGDMSLIGPRPHAVAHDDKYSSLIPNYAFRHHVKPGISGWAQVNGFRGETSNLKLMEKRIDLDLWYINHWSLALDLQILIRTFFELLRGRNAH